MFLNLRDVRACHVLNWSLAEITWRLRLGVILLDTLGGLRSFGEMLHSIYI